MAEAARGRDATIQVIDNETGDLVAVGNPDSFEARLSGEMGRDERLGEVEPDTTERLDGCEGTMTFKADNPILDELTQRKIENHKTTRRRYRINILETIYYPETAATKTYMYPDCVWMPSKSVGGRNDHITTQIEWQSKLRQEV